MFGNGPENLVIGHGFLRPVDPFSIVLGPEINQGIDKIALQIECKEIHLLIALLIDSYTHFFPFEEYPG